MGVGRPEGGGLGRGNGVLRRMSPSLASLTPALIPGAPGPPGYQGGRQGQHQVQTPAGHLGVRDMATRSEGQCHFHCPGPAAGMDGPWAYGDTGRAPGCRRLFC